MYTVNWNETDKTCVYRKFAGHEQANARVKIWDCGVIELYSYNTRVAVIDDGWLTVKGLYSATTRKHLGWFAKSLGLTYKDLKWICVEGLEYNIYTGEIIER